MRNLAKGCIMVNVGALLLLLVGCDSEADHIARASLLKRAIANMQVLKSYHIDEQINMGIAHDLISGDVDQVHSRSSITDEHISEGGVDDIYHSIQIGKRIYSDSGCGQLSVSDTPGDASNVANMSRASFWNTFTPELLDRISGSIGDGAPPTEQIDGIPTRHLTLSGLELPPPSIYVTDTRSLAAIKVDLWISSETTPTVRELNYTYPPDPKSVYPTSHDTLKWSKFNQPLNIQPPAQVAVCPTFQPTPSGPPYVAPTPVPTPTG